MDLSLSFIVYCIWIMDFFLFQVMVMVIWPFIQFSPFNSLCVCVCVYQKENSIQKFNSIFKWWFWLFGHCWCLFVCVWCVIQKYPRMKRSVFLLFPYNFPFLIIWTLTKFRVFFSSSIPLNCSFLFNIIIIRPWLHYHYQI